MNPNRILMEESQWIVVCPSAKVEDLAACALAQAIILADGKEPVPVYYREPTQLEVGSPIVLTIGVGGEHNPPLNNYDPVRRFSGDDAPTDSLGIMLQALRLPNSVESAIRDSATATVSLGIILRALRLPNSVERAIRDSATAAVASFHPSPDGNDFSDSGFLAEVGKSLVEALRRKS
jgi:hypothetical protein